MIGTEHCRGCRNNFYNGKNSLGVKQCWSLANAELVTKYSIGRDVPMNIRETYYKSKKPSCYHGDGYAHLDAIPSYAQTKAQRDAAAKEAARANRSAPVGVITHFEYP